MPSLLKSAKKGVCLFMNAMTKLERVRDLARSKMIQVSAYSGEEMNGPRTNLHRDSFFDGERTLAAQILQVLDADDGEAMPIEEEMVLGR